MKYDVILADPPWRFRAWSNPGYSQNAEHHYPTMGIDDICSLEVGKFAAPNCALFLWVVSPTLFEYPEKVLDAWGFTFKTFAFVWVKTVGLTRRPRVGLGHYTRSAAEMCLLAIRGSMPVADKTVSQVIFAPVTNHSAKPIEQYEKIERLYPAARKIELFARNRRQGWDAWGNEIRSDIVLPSTKKEVVR